MKKRLGLLLTLAITLIIFSSAVIRHDVSKRKYLLLAKQPQFDCAGRVWKNEKSNGSCVLIGKSFVLTAAHLFNEYDYVLDSSMYEEYQIIINRPFNRRVLDISNFYFEFNGKKYHGKNLTIHPTYPDSTSNNDGDIALVELETEVSDVVPAILNEDQNELHQIATGVGFGYYSVGNKPEVSKEMKKKMAGQNLIDSIGGDLLNGTPTHLFSDFDDPTDSTKSKLGGKRPLPLEYLADGGDSGSGQFIQTPNGWKLVGIGATIYYTITLENEFDKYGTLMSYTRVKPYVDWIKETTRIDD